jgi:thymidylate synthase (FAD)
MKLKHGAVLEHGTIYLKYESEVVRGVQECDILFQKYKNNKFSVYNTSKVTRKNETVAGGYVTTNLRVLMENGWMDDLQYLSEPTKYHEKRITAKFICSRSIAQEITRHRVFSFLMESQRYVGYNKDKFGGEITIIIPEWIKARINDIASYNNNDDLASMSYAAALRDGRMHEDKAIIMWAVSQEMSETHYLSLTSELNVKAEEARSVLTNDCKTELVMTGFISDWEHFFDLRSKGITGKPHPDIKILADTLYLEFINKGYLK